MTGLGPNVNLRAPFPEDYQNPAQVAAELLHYRLYQDEQTGLLNRQGATELIEHLVEANTPFGLFIADGDGLKQINDSYGHAAGDAAIAGLAARLSEALRAHNEADIEASDVIARGRTLQTDLPRRRWIDVNKATAARYGKGDEFIAMVPNLTHESLKLVKQRLSQRLVFVAADQTETAELGKLKISASIGGSLWRPGLKINDVLHTADAELYRAKGRRKESVNHPST